jgi:hypothetical protein
MVRRVIRFEASGRDSVESTGGGAISEKVLAGLRFVALDLARLPEIFSRLVEQATDGPRKGLNPPPSFC